MFKTRNAKISRNFRDVREIRQSIHENKVQGVPGLFIEGSEAHSGLRFFTCV